MIEDKNKAITVKYNLQNLPVLVDWGKGRKIEWLYSANGTKLRKNVYDNGHLNTITDYANGLQTYNYTYDNNGNVISDTYRGVVNVVYNNRNLPEQLTASGSIVVNYSYDGAGNRIRKQSEYDDEIYVLGAGGVTEAVFEANGNPKFFNITAGAENLGRYEPLLDELKLMNKILKGKYSGNRIIVGPSVTVTGVAELKAGTSVRLKPGFRAFAGCSLKVYIDSTAINLTRFYYLKDHLGSIRVTVNQSGEEVVSHDDYDPWGMQLDGRSGNLASAFDKYKFTGKERDVETGYDYFGARYYDSRIARWMQVDPLAEKYPGWSPYNYVKNNPLRFVDPNGEELEVIPNSEKEYELIKKSLEPTDAKYVKLDKHGKIDKELLLQANSSDGNFVALVELVTSENTYRVFSNDEFAYKDENGTFHKWNMKPASGDEGFTGISIAPDNSAVSSPTHEFQVTINSNNTE